MTQEQLLARFRAVAQTSMPFPGTGQTAVRHRRLLEIARESLSLARLAEAHFDALAILAEAGVAPEPKALYGVWASEKSGEPFALRPDGARFTLDGPKRYCSGAGLLDRALITVGAPEQRLVDFDLRTNAGTLEIDYSDWKVEAFRETCTATVTFHNALVQSENLVGGPRWYLERPGFWHGACGPAACWAGGALGLVDYAITQSRKDPHTLAHLGAMHAAGWALQTYLDSAGDEIDAAPQNVLQARLRARTVRHLVESAATAILERLRRAYGPQPLAMDRDVALRFQELELYLLQWHAERDLEALGQDVRTLASSSRSNGVAK